MSRVLVLRALGLGDFLTAVPALRAVRRAFPSSLVVLAAPSVLSPLAALTGAVDEVLDTAPLAPVPWTGPPPDVAVNLHGRGPQSHGVLAALRPGRLVAFACGSVAGPAWRDDEHEVVRWCRLLSSSGIPADPTDLLLPPPLPPSPLPQLVGAVVVHPGAASRARRWPAERFAAVARAVAATGSRVVVTGSDSERSLAADVAGLADLPPSAVLAGSTSLLDLAAVVAHAAAVVSNDTGVAHLASAFARPSVVLFGPTPPALWGPPPRSRHRALWAGYAGDPHGDVPFDGLLEISVPDVLEALDGVRAAAARCTAPLAPPAGPATPPANPAAR